MDIILKKKQRIWTPENDDYLQTIAYQMGQRSIMLKHGSTVTISKPLYQETERMKWIIGLPFDKKKILEYMKHKRNYKKSLEFFRHHPHTQWYR